MRFGVIHAMLLFTLLTIEPVLMFKEFSISPAKNAGSRSEHERIARWDRWFEHEWHNYEMYNGGAIRAGFRMHPFNIMDD